MDKRQIELINSLKDEKGMSISSLASACGISHMTIRRILQEESYNPTIETIRSIAKALDVDEQEIIGGKDIPTIKDVDGFVEYLGKTKRIKSFNDLEALYHQMIFDKGASKEASKIKSEDKTAKQALSKYKLDVSSINLFQTEHYDTTIIPTWDFRKSEDERDEQPNNLGNMCKGYEFDMCGVHFLNSEAAYICGLFSNDSKEHYAIQYELIHEPNGYSTKKVIRRKHEEQGRNDWETFNVQWMLYCVWNKCKSNKAFSGILKLIPSNYTIVENSTRNKLLEQKRDIVERDAELKNQDMNAKELAKKMMQARNSISLGFGSYEGVNCMGKILTICKYCIEHSTEPPIDYELLRSKKIYLLGELLTFDESKLHQPKKKK